MGVLFIVAGVVAILSVVVLTSNPAALPWVLVSWPLTVIAGYRVWRTANPTKDIRQEVAGRGRAVVAGIVGVSLVAVALAAPQFVALAVGIWVAVIAVLFIALAIASRNAPDS